MLLIYFSCKPASPNRLLIIFANSLDPDQDRQNVGSDLYPNRLVLKDCLKKVNFEKQKSARACKNTQYVNSKYRSHVCLWSSVEQNWSK